MGQTSCLTSLGEEHDEIIEKQCDSNPDFLTNKVNMTQSAKRLAGVCPLTALDVAR